MRFVVQSQRTGRFLAPSPAGDLTHWVRSLREAGGGVVRDEDSALQLLQDHTEPEDRACLVDLDRLGTADDYTVPDGNHGDNEL